MFKIQIFKLLFCFPVIFGSSYALAQQNEKNFIPKGWNTILRTSGDLNKDNLPDLALVIEAQNKDNFKSNDQFGPDTLNLNPRNIIILLKQNDGSYTKISENKKGFVPPENDELNSCLADPLMENGNLEIKNGILEITFNYWLSCGSWFVNNATYKFRYQNKNLELIGYDHYEFHRASGESSSSSINFSTKKIEEITGLNEFAESNPKTKWRSFKFPTLLKLDELDAETYFKIGEI